MDTNPKPRSAYFALLAGLLFSLPVAADLNDLLEMSEKLDKIEKQDFVDAIDKANACTRARDFSCTDAQLGKAAKLANGARDKQMLAAAQQSMANERARIAEEERQRAEEQRRIAEAEERLRIAEAEAARRSAEASGPSTTMQLLQMGTAIMGSMAAEKARLAGLASATRSQSGLPLADLSTERRAIEKARTEAAAGQRAREQANTTRLAAANTSAVTASRTASQANAAVSSSFQTPEVYISPTRESCPPGFSPMRHSNGVALTVPAGAACVADTPRGSVQAASENRAGSGAGASGAAQRNTNNGSTSTGAGTPGTSTRTTTVRGPNTDDRLAANTTKGQLDTSAPSDTTKKKIEWGPIKLEALAVCRQSEKNKKWVCNGSLDNQFVVDEPTLESALARQHCAGGTWAAGGPIIDGLQWDAYRCGKSLGAGDYDVAKRYNLVTARRSYMCPKYTPGDGRCTTFYDGQDKR